MIAVVGVLLAAAGGILAARGPAVARWQGVAGLAALVVALGLLRLAPEGQPPGTIELSAISAGEPAVTRVVVVPPGERHQTFAVPLQRTVHAAPAVLWTMGGLALLGLAFGHRLGRLAAVLPGLAAAAGVVAFALAAGVESGEPAVRAFLGRALSGVAIERFTVPPEGWVFPGGGLALACGAAAGVALLAAARGFLKEIEPLSALVPVGAAIAVGGVGWQLLAAGGPWWTPTDGLAVAAALATSGAVFVDHPTLRPVLLSVAVGLAGLTGAVT